MLLSLGFQSVYFEDNVLPLECHGEGLYLYIQIIKKMVTVIEINEFSSLFSLLQL